MKLLYVFPEEFAGRFAREYHIFRLAESLAAAGCDVTLAAAPSERLHTDEQLHAFFGGSRSPRLKIAWLKREIKIGPWKIRSSMRFNRRLDWLVWSLKPDAAYTMHLKGAHHIGRRHPTLPLIFEAHEIFADSYPEDNPKHQALLSFEAKVHAHARAVVAISAYLAECLKDAFDLKVPVHVQHDGIDESMLLDLAQAPDPHELVYAGSLQSWKGVPVALEAMRLLPEFHLTVLGGGGAPLDQLRRSAPANVTFHGQITREAMLPFLQKASIGLMPNLPEPRSALYTFPLKLLEYSAAGQGIVASHIPVFDQLDVGAWTQIVPSGDPAALAEGVRGLVKRGIDRPAAQAWARQFLWPNQGIALKKFLEAQL